MCPVRSSNTAKRSPDEEVAMATKFLVFPWLSIRDKKGVVNAKNDPSLAQW